MKVTQNGTAKVVRIINEGTFHSDGAIGDEVDNIVNDDTISAIGMDSRDQIYLELKAKMDEAIGNVLSRCDLKQLEEIMWLYGYLLSFRLGPDPPADVEIMRLQMDPGARPAI